MAAWTHIVDLVDTDRYPLHDPLLASYASLLHESSLAYRTDGVVHLPGLFRPEAVDRMVEEAERLAPLAHRIPGREACVAYDLFPLDSLLRSFYEWSGLLRFVSGVTGELVMFRSADPLGALVLSVMTDGDALEPAYCRPSVQISIALSTPEHGGAELSAGRVHPPPTPGTVCLWDGDRLAHGVGPIAGSRARYEARMFFGPLPGADSSDAEKLQRFGRLPGPSRRG